MRSLATAYSCQALFTPILYSTHATEKRLLPRNPILVLAFDFDDTGSQILQETRRLTEAFPHTDIHIVHVANTHEISRQSASTLLEKQDDAFEELRRLLWANIYSIFGPTLKRVQMSVEICFGDKEDEILRAADAKGADWLVVGEGKSPFGGLFRAPLTQRLVANAPCSVLMVRARESIPTSEPRSMTHDLSRRRAGRMNPPSARPLSRG